MLSIFPELLTFNLLGITIIRLVIGLTMLYVGGDILRKKDAISSFLSSKKILLSSFVPIVLGVLIFLFGLSISVGFITQICATVLAYLLINLFIIEKYSKTTSYGTPFYVIMIFITLSMLLTGPGLFAIDLPL